MLAVARIRRLCSAVHNLRVSSPINTAWHGIYFDDPEARITALLRFTKRLSHNPEPRSSGQTAGESGKHSEGRCGYRRSAVSRRTKRAPRSQPPCGAKADGTRYGIGSKDRRQGVNLNRAEARRKEP